jgi:hypothetical protein
MTNLMIDLETLSTAVDAVILQIGLVPFELNGDGPSSPGILIQVDPTTCLDAGFRVDWPTIHWWIMQEQAAREALPRPGQGVSLYEALMTVQNYIAALYPPLLYVWSNGANFDIPILANAFRTLGMPEPWHYASARDTRTLSMLAQNAVRPKRGVNHNALDDAINQVYWVQNMWRELPAAWARTSPPGEGKTGEGPPYPQAGQQGHSTGKRVKDQEGG